MSDSDGHSLHLAARRLRGNGPLAQLVGFAVFLALVVAAVTSSVSLVEVVPASVIDRFDIARIPPRDVEPWFD